ncbi:Ig-like domain-containing protein [Streptomyces sp. NPDC048717]|uniref:L,D-transpeptidase n=1 Tax=Streptomyces sp. NPDC048717 TaxID=3154928 RepID=UPI00343D634C
MNGQPISAAFAGRRSRRAIRGLGALATGTMLLVLTACGGGDDKGASGSVGAGSGGDTAASQAVVAIAPKDGADAVATNGALKVTAEKGKLTTVTVADSEGHEVEGKMSADGASWEPTGHLSASTKYKVHAIAKDSAGLESAKDTSFTTLVPQNTFIGQYTPENGQTVGVGMPVSFRFSRGITDPEAVERGIKVTAEPAVDIEGHWFGNDRLDFRPEDYWAAGTKVTVQLNLDGVEGRPGVYGKQKKTFSFTIGRRQVSTVDASAKTMKIERDGAVIKTIPISAGAPSTTTYNGQMVISEKFKITRMNGATVGFGGEYDIKDVPHAMRLSNSGTFIHGNYWGSPSIFGTTNTSHGCVGLQDARGAGDSSMPAAWFFDHSLIGDVVVVKNSRDKQIQPDNGLNGWNMSWSEWKA